jgi:hypothetical protein
VKKPPVERRVSPTWRRQFNEAFCDPFGHFSPSKAISLSAQVMVLYWTGILMDRLIDKPETLLILLCFLIAPELIKKALSMKLGGAQGGAK